MGKLLLCSLLFLSIFFSNSCNKKNVASNAETQKKDSVIIHKAPNQEAIDSIKLLKTKKKLKKEKEKN